MSLQKHKPPTTNIEDWINPKINIKKSLIEGQGLFANKNIKKGEKLIVWGGDYINSNEVKKYKKMGKLVIQWDEDLYSVEERGDEKGYFINHSCEPNMWMIDAYTIIAKRNIAINEELAIDYALFEANENYISKWQCQCGSSLCRGQITGTDWRNPKLQDRYKNHFSPLLNKRIQEIKKFKS